MVWRLTSTPSRAWIWAWRYSGRPSAYLATAIWASRRSVGRPPSIRRAGAELRLEDLLDALQLRRQGLARSRRPLGLFGGGRLQPGRDGTQAGLDLLEGEVELIVIELLGRAPETRPLQRFQDGVETRVAGVGVRLRGPQAIRLRLQRLDLGLRGEDQRLQRRDVVGQIAGGQRHGRE
jgi:hypothetical protein